MVRLQRRTHSCTHDRDRYVRGYNGNISRRVQSAAEFNCRKLVVIELHSVVLRDERSSVCRDGFIVVKSVVG